MIFMKLNKFHRQIIDVMKDIESKDKQYSTADIISEYVGQSPATVEFALEELNMMNQVAKHQIGSGSIMYVLRK